MSWNLPNNKWTLCLWQKQFHEPIDENSQKQTNFSASKNKPTYSWILNQYKSSQDVITKFLPSYYLKYIYIFCQHHFQLPYIFVRLCSFCGLVRIIVFYFISFFFKHYTVSHITYSGSGKQKINVTQNKPTKIHIILS